MYLAYHRLRGFSLDDSKLGFGEIRYIDDNRTVAVFDGRGRWALPTPVFLELLERSNGGTILQDIAERLFTRREDVLILNWGRHRQPHCWHCEADLDSEQDTQCRRCHWLKCPECESCEPGCQETRGRKPAPQVPFWKRVGR